MTAIEQKVSAYLNNVLATTPTLHQVKEIIKIVNAEVEEMQDEIESLKMQADKTEPLF